MSAILRAANAAHEADKHSADRLATREKLSRPPSKLPNFNR